MRGNIKHHAASSHYRKPLLHKEVKSLILITVFAAVVITLGFFALNLYRVEFAGLAYKGTEVHLSDYPYPFVEEGRYNTIIVVGDTAPAEDVVGAVHIVNHLSTFVTEPADNCPDAYNPLQEDEDNDGWEMPAIVKVMESVEKYTTALKEAHQMQIALHVLLTQTAG